MEPRNANGVNALAKQVPVGFRFRPTDEELLLHYLKRKICSLPLPADVIHESDVFSLSPWDLPGDVKEKRYFFCKAQRKAASHCSGYWKETSKHKHITSTGNGNSLAVIGLKRSFIFHGRKHERTRWMMREFCLVGCVNYCPSSSQKLMMQVGDWLVCLVYQKKARNRCSKSINYNSMNLQLKEEAQTAISSPCFSGITEISSSSERGLVDQQARQ